MESQGGANPFTLSHNYVQNCFIPIFSQYRSEVESKQIVDKSSYNDLLKKLNEVNLAFIKCRQNVDVPEIILIFHPKIKEVIQSCKSKNVKHSQEDAIALNTAENLPGITQTVQKWLTDINAIMNLKFELNNASIVDEINYWMSMERSLLFIENQLKSPEVELTIEVLKEAKRVNITAQFNDMTFKQTLLKCQKCNAFMKEFPINSLLIANSLPDLKESLILMFAHMKKLVNITDYPQQRSLQLAEALSRELNNQIIKFFKGIPIMFIKYSEYQAQAQKLTEIFFVWEEEYKLFKQNFSKASKTAQNTMRDQYGLFEHSKLQKLLYSISKIRETDQNLKEVIQSIVDKDEGDQHLHILEEINAAYQLFHNIDVFETKDQEFDQMIKEYEIAIENVEATITVNLRDQLGQTTSSKEMFRIFGKFNKLFQRPRIKGAIQEYQTQLLKTVQKDIQSLQEKYKNKYQKSQNARISAVRDIPPTSGYLIWAKQLQIKLQKYMQQVEQILGPNWAEDQEGKKCRDIGVTFEKILDTTPIVDQFKNEMGNANKQQNQVEKIFEILQKKKTLEIKVNFDKKLSCLFKEVRNMNNFKQKMSYTITYFAADCKANYVIAQALQESLHTYQQISSQLNPKSAKLVAALRKEIQNFISVGFNYQWSNKSQMGPYAKKFTEKVYELEQAVNGLNEKVGQIESFCEAMKTCQISSLQQNLKDIQMVIDELSFKSFSNLHLWTSELDSQVELILADRATEHIQQWLNQFINYQTVSDRSLIETPVIHELKLQNQIIYVDPPVEYARYFWYAHFHQQLGTICSVPRLVANRYGRDIKQISFGGPEKDEDYASAMHRVSKDLIKDCYTKINSVLNSMQSYVQTWLNYQSLWELDIKQVEALLNDDIDKWQQMLSDIKSGRETFDNSETEQFFGAIVIDYRMVQAKINNKYDAWHKELLAHFGTKFGDQLRQFNKIIGQEKDKLLKINFQNLQSDIIESITILQEQDKKFPSWSSEYESFKNGQKVLERQRYQYPSDWLSISQVEQQWNQFTQIRAKKQDQMQTEMQNIQLKISQDEKYLNQQINDIEEQWKSSKPDSGELSPDEAQNILKSLSAQLTQVSEKYNKCGKAKEILRMPAPVQQQKLDNLCDQINDLQEVWDELSHVWSAVIEIRDTQLQMIQEKKIKDSIDEATKRLNGVSTKTRNYDAFEAMKKKQQSYAKMNRLIMELKSEAMKERHWRQLLAKLKIGESVNQLRIGQLWNANLLGYEPFVKDVLNVARGEMVLESMITTVKEFWNAFELELVKYQTKCKLIRGWDDLFTKLDEDLNNLASMKISPFYKSFESDISSWDDKLQKVKLTLDVWIDVQRRWVYLEGIFFGASDIKTQLQNEFNKFKDIDNQFTGLMKKVAQNPKLMDVMTIQGIQKQLDRLSEYLQKIQKALGDYLETQRQAFARFYFVGDDDLLDIIGNSKEATNVQRHFTKMYAGIVALQSRKDGADDVVLGMSSKEGESVNFVKEIKIADDPRINIWLGKVDNEMMTSLALELSSSVQEITDLQEDRMKIIEKHPAQMILLALQVHWCHSIEAAFGKPEAMEAVLQYVLKFLAELAESVLLDHPKQLRQKFEQIITDFVHQRDVTRQLIKTGVTSKTEFGWQYHMRFIWNAKESEVGKKLLIQMGNANFHYGFEYLGVAEKLVQTPLTDKCYLTLTQALHLRMGGSPFGPAGTGKTESVKALGAQLGRFVLVFNCDETFDFNAMGRIFVGLCQVGAWGCFDEFNRLEERMLSACSQQILLIQMGLREKSKQIELMGKDVKLNPQMGVFVTMNPGYAGRSNLPENLKQLFRQMAMVKPDRELIAQVMLYSQGFRTAERLAGKIVSLFELCDNQLSSQPHYDFGLRALKSVLNSAGNMKRQEMIERNQVPVPDNEISDFEQMILLRSVCDTVVPKLVKEDIKLLETLLQGVFPGSSIPEVKEEQLRTQLKIACDKKNLLASKNFIEKVLQLYQIQRLQHGLMLVGPCGCGKSAAWKVLLEAMFKCTKVKGESYIIDPKAISKDELYGHLDNTTLEWTDGVFTSILRRIISNQNRESTKNHWIIFDGDVDPEWAENLNSVLDDNKLLTLPNGERLAIPPNVRLIFEVETLKYATLATVSRCGMVWFSEETIDDQNIFHHFTERLKQQQYDQNKPDEEITDEKIKPILKVREQCVAAIQDVLSVLAQILLVAQKPEYKHVMEFTRIRVLESTFALVRRAISNIIEYNENNSDFQLEEQQLNAYMEKCFLQAIMWGVAGSMNLHQRTLFSKEICALVPSSVVLPQFNDSCPSLIDFEVLLPSGEWGQWKKKVPQIEIDQTKVTDADLIIETVDTLRHKEVLCGWLSEHRPFLLCGPPGSGKTMTLMSTLKALTDFEMIFVNFSSSTMPSLIIKQFEHYCEYKKTINGVILQPKSNKWLVVFCDEINLPDQDKYGTMPIITFLRQLTEQHGFWRASDRSFIQLERIQFVGACNPPTDVGRKPLSPRFLRHTPLILVDFPGPESLKQIYGTFNKAMLKKKNMLKHLSDPLTNAMVEFYTTSQQHFTSDMQAHYIYSPRELTRWKFAINEALEPLESQEDLVRLWAHEAFRLFSDRLVHEHEKKWCSELVDKVAQNNFSSLKEEALARPILFSNYLSKEYSSVDREELRKYIEGKLKTFNDEELAVPLVIFDDVVDNILRIDRVLRQPLGHLLLVGASGVGKTTLTRFVSWINNYATHQIKAGRDYQLADFDNDLRDVMKRAGVKKEKITFIFDESNVLGPAFLEKMNALLASGEIPGLFDGDEYLQLINLLKEASSQNKQFETEEQLYKNFIKQVQINLHVVFTMNPANPDFSNRTASSPALFNRCVINWFGDWNNEALFQVGKAFTQFIDPPENAFSIKVADRQQVLVRTLVYIQNTIVDLNLKLQKGGKRFNYITPRDFLDFLKHFDKLHHEKKSNLEDQQLHLNVGLDKLKETETQVLDMQKSLDSKKIELEAKEKQASQKLQSILQEEKMAEQKKTEALRLSKEAEIKFKQISERESVVNKELAEALPALENAKQCVSGIKKSDLDQIKGFKQPPLLVKLTMEAVVCTITHKHKAIEWKDVTQCIAQMNFIKNVMEFNTETLPPKVKEFVLNNYINKAEWDQNKIMYASQAAGPLAMWVASQLKYADILLNVDPLRQEVAKLKSEGEEINAKKIVYDQEVQLAEQKIKQLQDEYAELISQKENIKQEMLKVHEKVTRSQSLLNNLSSERVRWEDSSQSFKFQLATMVGDVLLSSAYLSYIGFFDHFYRKLIVTTWKDHLQNVAQFQLRQDLALIEFLSKPSDRLLWQANTLPSDDLCMENAIILQRYQRYPLVIDPSGQALQFLTLLYKDKKLNRTSFTDESFLKTLETCLRFGVPLLVQDVEKIDPILNSVLNNETYKTGGRVLIRVGNQEIDFSQGFTMFMITRDSSAKFTPDLCSRVTFVNFTVTQSSLQEQCLNIFLRNESPETEQNRIKLMKLQGEYIVKLRELEDKLLDSLNNVQGSILEDEKVIKTLETLKSEASIVVEEMKKSDSIMSEVTAITQTYVPLASSTSKIFFTLQSLERIHYLYQFSLAFFMETIYNVLKNLQNEKKTMDQRRILIFNEIFKEVYKRMNLALLSTDKIVFASALAQVKIGDFPINHDFLTLFKPPSVAETTLSTNLLQGKLQLSQLKSLEAICQQPQYYHLLKHVQSNEQNWMNFLASENPEQEIPFEVQTEIDNQKVAWSSDPNKFLQNLNTYIAQAHIIRIFRPDRFQVQISKMIQHILGEGFMEELNVDMKNVVDRESNSKTPILLCSAPGFDPSFKVEQLARETGTRLVSVAIGSAEGFEQADQAITSGVKTGTWVMLKNVHLATTWLNDLEKKLFRLNPHDKFRIFLTMEFNPKVPATLIRQSYKLVFEPPDGIKASLTRTYKTVLSQSRSDKQPVERARLHFLLAWLHAVILERLRFTPIGWSKMYEFNEADQRCSLDLIDEYIDALGPRQNIDPAKLPWDAFRVILTQNLYGGKVDNEYDSKILQSLVEQFFCEQSFNPSHKLFDGRDSFNVPEGRNYGDFMQWVEALPKIESPEWSGLPANVERVQRELKSSEMVVKVQSLQQETEDEITMLEPKQQKNKKNEQAQWLVELLERVQRYNVLLPENVRLLERTAASINDPLFRFLDREINIATKLLKTVRQNLVELMNLASGKTLATNQLRQLAKDVYNDVLPATWNKYNVIALPLNDWIGDFKKRIDQFNELSNSHIRKVWFGGLLFPEAYLTATRQFVAQRNHWSLEELELTLVPYASDEDCFTIEGLSMEGGIIDSDTLEVNIVPEISTLLKPLHIKWNHTTQRGGGAPVIVLNTNTKRENGRKAQLTNIQAAKAVSDIVLTTLGPRSMLKMLLDPMGGIVMTNDGNAILREIDVQHPAAKSMIELARVFEYSKQAQDEEVGDGTTSVIILAGEMMLAARPFVEKNIHPTEIVGGYFKALEQAVLILDDIAQKIDLSKDDEIMRALQSCIGTKFAFRWGTMISDLALKATRYVMCGGNLNKLNLEIKRYAKVEKIPGGTLEDSEVLDGVMVNKDVTHPKMRREIRNPRVLLLDSTLEYKKGESMTNMEMTKESDMTDALQQEMTEVMLMCNDILKWNPDIVITEKGVSDLAQHFLLKQNVSVIRRVRKTDNNRIARVTGATIVSRPEEIQESDIGTNCGLFEVKKIGDDYFAFFVECKKPTACSIILRGASKDVLNEMERNLQDCLAVAKNIFCEPKLLPGGGAVEMEVSARLLEKANKVEGLAQLPFKAVAYALEIIPRTLANNCGADVVRILTELRAKHSEPNGLLYGIDGNTGKISDMSQINVWEPLAVKKNTPVRLVLRRKPDGKLLPGAHLVEREFLITSKLSAVGFPVPKPLLLCEDASIVGTTFYVMEFVEGRIFKDSKFTGVSASERRELVFEHVRTLAKLHSIDFTKLDLSSFGKADKFYERQINTWTRQYKFAETDRNEWIEQLIEWLPKNIKETSDDSIGICHGDFAINNVIFHPTEPKIIAVIDWELSTIGRSFADLGYVLQPYFMSPYPIDSHPGGYKGFMHLLDMPSVEEVVAQYTNIRGLNKPDLRFQIAFSMFRLASITQGVYKRALQGNASQKEQGLQMLKLSKFLSKDAWDVVKLINPDPFGIQTLIDNDQPRWGQWPISERCKYYYYQVKKLLLEEIIPLEKEMLHLAESRTGNQKWKPLPQLQKLKEKAKSLGLFNLFCTYPTFGRGLTNLEYAFICELMGMSPFAPEVFNCSAPDTGNMEVLILYGNREQQIKYLIPLLEGEIRSCFAMTEPAVASSDATNIQTSIQKNEKGYLINGKKWYISGAGDERCKVAIVMGKTDINAKTHQQQSMVLVDLPHPNVQITRPMHVFGYDEAPHGHMEMVFTNTQVPPENLLLREGAGFEIAQGRLGGGRLHHCMRLIGICHRVLDLMIQRGETRIVFKKKLGANDSFQQKLGELETLLSSARLMVFNAAMQLDLLGNKRSFTLKALSECKVYVPKIAQQIIDEAIQVFGAEGVSQDQILTQAFIAARTLRIADGPDAVHYRQVARFATYNSSKSDFAQGKGYGLAKL